MPIEIRPFTPSDDLERLTALVRAAYAPHVASGLRFWGTHQTVADTAERFASGIGLVMLSGGDYIGTALVRPPKPDSPVPFYRDPSIRSLSQFCIAPSHKGQGLGKLLHARALDVAREGGAKRMLLDTAKPARALIALYEAWGYRVVGECDWRPDTNYLSVVMARDVEA